VGNSTKEAAMDIAQIKENVGVIVEKSDELLDAAEAVESAKLALEAAEATFAYAAGALEAATKAPITPTRQEQEVADQEADQPSDADGIGMSDGYGRPLSVGDRVRVTGSSRYGTIEGIVRGQAAPGRIGIDLDIDTSDECDEDQDADPNYSASQGRVEKLAYKV
jgi:hypothetical protein